MHVWTAKVEGPVSVMTILALRVRMFRGMRLQITSSLRASERVICGTRMYDDRVGVLGPAAGDCCQWKRVRWKEGMLYVLAETKDEPRALG